jgi:hypothetical protein
MDSNKNAPESRERANDGSHPVGTGLGAAAGGVTGLGIGAALGGPVGAAIGAAAGAVAGGLGGKRVAEAVDPAAEEAYWRQNYATRPYVDPEDPFDLYLPAYRLGWESRARTWEERDLTFTDIEDRLASEWNRLSTKTELTWEKAKSAVRDAWDRLAIDRAENEGMPPLRRHDSTVTGGNYPKGGQTPGSRI